MKTNIFGQHVGFPYKMIAISLPAEILLPLQNLHRITAQQHLHVKALMLLIGFQMSEIDLSLH